MPTARAGSAFGSINGRIYIVGGHDGVNSLNVLESYDPVSNSWTTNTPMPTSRQYAGSAAINGLLYVAGGHTLSSCCFDTLEVYDPATDAWATRASLPTPEGGPASASINGKLYVVGGISQSAFNNPRNGVVQVYDPTTNTWTTGSSMPTARAYAAAVEINGQLYVVGGTPTGTSYTGALEVYDPGTDTWTSKAPMPTPRQLLVVAAVNGLLYAIGGDPGDGTPDTVVNEVYDPATDTWTTDAPMPTSRYGMASGVINATVYVVGGATGFGSGVPQDIAEAFTPAQVLSAAIQPPINANGSSVFNARRGVVPVKFTLAANGAPTCELPSATISLFRTAGGSLGPINESNFIQPSDSGSNFRIDVTNCQYVYNLGSSSLGVGTYLVQINIGGGAVGAGTFSLK